MVIGSKPVGKRENHACSGAGGQRGSGLDRGLFPSPLSMQLGSMAQVPRFPAPQPLHNADYANHNPQLRDSGIIGHYVNWGFNAGGLCVLSCFHSGVVPPSGIRRVSFDRDDLPHADLLGEGYFYIALCLVLIYI